MGTSKKKRPQQSLAASRPPILHKPKSISRKATRTLINAVHTLEKKKQQASVKGDKGGEAAIEKEISALGGLKKYQEASLQGQKNDRGGDSSKVLLDWLEPLDTTIRSSLRPLRMLEVGALSTSNACSRSGLFNIERIDLNSQGDGILQQDFMDRPLPKDDSEKFDTISLSLVLNFVPDPKGRGDMLLRTLDFLRVPSVYSEEPLGSMFPCLFLVLPAPCILNSRYLDEARLETIMTSLGYQKTQTKVTQKLVYHLWRRHTSITGRKMHFPKKEIRSGGSRNNFAIVLKSEG